MRECLETGLTRTEGCDGVSEILTNISSVPIVTVQVAGDGLHFPAETLREEWHRGGALQHLLIHYNDVAATQSSR